MSSEEPDAFAEPSEPAEPVGLSAQELAQIAALEEMSGLLEQDARSWAAQLRTVGSLVELAGRPKTTGRSSSCRWSWPGRGGSPS